MADRSDLLAKRKHELERRLAELSPTKRASIERAWAADSGAPPAIETVRTIPPRPSGAPIPMSFAQELLWLLERTSPGHTYNVPRMVRLTGALDVDALQLALDALVARHEVLRTTFSLVDGEPRQIVHQPSAVEITRIDLGDVAAEDRETSARQHARELASVPFDLERDPQLRTSVIRLTAQDHVLVLVSHHVASDGWSGNILLRELGRLYEGFRTSIPAELTPLMAQYADYAAWQRQTIAGAHLEALLAFWRSQLAGVPTVLDLPADRPRPAVPTFEGGSHSVTLPHAALDGVGRLAQDTGATSFMVFLSVLYVLLYRYTGEEELVVGTPVAGRSLPELDGIVGFFTNTLLLRGSLAGNPTFRQLLDRVRSACLAAFDHQEIPLEKLLLERGPDGQPIATAPQVVLITEDPERQSFQLPGTTSIPFGVTRGATKFDLSLRAAERADGIRLGIEYRTDLFDAATIDRMLGHYSALLEAATAAPDIPVTELAIMSPAERRRVVVEWNDTAVEYGADDTLLDLLEAQAARTPTAVAVEDELGSLTYADLRARADALSNWLCSEGVGPGSLVAVCLERSLDLVVALVGVLKAGAAYVPLDPEYPADRLSFMLDDAGATVVLTQARLAALIPPHTGITLALDAEWARVLATAPVGSPKRPSPTDPAYMIYTSGSTGRPKGAVNSHRGIANRLCWMQRTYRLTATDAVLQKTPTSFDVSVWEFFWPLMTGARLVMARPGGHHDARYIGDVVAKCRITVLHFVPSMLAAFLDEPALAARCSSVRDVICSGEALPVALTRRFFAQIPDTRLHNLYGPTEAAVDVAFFECHADEMRATVPIGRPVGNTRLYVLDARLHPVPIGVPGDLYIGGAQVGMGYHRRPELTAQRFVPDPFGSEGAARLYYTGDRGRWLADGILEFLGRADFQIKLHGQRIELGEIEAALLQQPGVAAAVVIVREDVPGNQRLVGYVVNSAESTVSVTDLREELRRRLPAVMVPTAIVFLDRLPLTPNGKVDRKSLAAPTGEARSVSAEYVAPWSPLEQEIAGIWTALLGVDRIGVHDDFFELGGNSLLAMRMFTEIERVWGRRLPFRSFFERPTVSEVVAVLVTVARDEEEHGIAVLQGEGPGIPLAFVHGDILGHGWYCRRLAPLLGPSPMFVLPTLGPSSPGSPLTIEAMAQAQVDALKRLRPTGPYRLGGYCHGGLVAYEMAKLLTAQGDVVESLVLVDAFCSNLRFRKFERLIRLLTGAGTAEAQLRRRARVYYRMHYYPWRLGRVWRMGWTEKRHWSARVMRRLLGLRAVASPEPVDKAVSSANAAPTDGLGPVGRFIARAQRGYVPGRYSGRVELISASSAMKGRQSTSAFEWEQVAAGISPHTVEGNHVGIVMPEGMPALAHQMKACLNRNAVP
jgi:amino acid adenylation domain-containing protein